jgi:hypothetical protein
MSLSDKFYAVDLNGRAVLLHEHGEYLVTRTYYGRKHNLYAMPGFYVELIYNRDENSIESINVINDVNKYLSFIQLEL